MKTYFTKFALTFFVFFITGMANVMLGQVVEWRLINPAYNSTDPDAAGPATGSVSFTLQIHTVSGTISNVNAISTGFSYQSALAMIPIAPACATVSNPANIIVSPFFVAGGFAYTTVFQCGIFNQTAGGQNFDRRAVGTMDGTAVTLTTTWQDMFTVTLWTLGSSFPNGGYVVINSGAGGSPGEFTTYAVADAAANEYVANSLTFTTPLALGAAVPVLFTKFETKCNGNGTLITWATAQESNSSHFEIEKSSNGSADWISIANISAAGNSSTDKNYQQIDLNGGSAFYRIKQVDKDGQFMYTGIERTNCEVKNITCVIYPVPARDVLNVVIKSDRVLNTNLMLFESTGKLVRKVNVYVLNGNNNYKINTIGLSDGEYILKSSNPSLIINKAFTVVH